LHWCDENVSFQENMSQVIFSSLIVNSEHERDYVNYHALATCGVRKRINQIKW